MLTSAPANRATATLSGKNALFTILAVWILAVVLWRNHGDGLTPLAIIRQSQSAYAALTSYRDTTKGTISDPAPASWTTCAIRLQRPKQYRVEWSSAGGPWMNLGIVWSDGATNFEIVNATPDKFATAKPQTARDPSAAFLIASAISGGAAATVPGGFFAINSVDKLATFTSGQSVVKRKSDETINGVDCYVVTSVVSAEKMQLIKMPSAVEKLGTTTITLWIGKHDHLIRQALTSLTGTIMRANASDAPAKPRSFSLAETHENIVVNQPYAAADFRR